MSGHTSVRARNKRRAVVNACQAVLETLECRQLLAATLFYENFDNMAWQNSREEGQGQGLPGSQGTPGENVWTNVPPSGWVKDDTGVPGYNNPDLPWDPNADPPVVPNQEDNNGITEWIGWTFAKKDWWVQTAGDQRRSEFTNASGGVMVADNDEWDDAPHPGKGTWAANELYNANITSPAIPLTHVTGNLALDFDSSWRPEGFDDPDNATGINNQTGIINAIFSDGTTREVMHWDSNAAGDFFHDHLPNEHVTLPLGDIPAGATSVKLQFLETNAANDWWWAVDNLNVTADVNIPGQRLIGVTGNQQHEFTPDDETLWNIDYSVGPSTDAKFLDGWEDIAGNPPDTVLYSQRDVGVTQGSGALRVDVPQADPNAVPPSPAAFWGVRSPNVVDLLKGGATQFSYDLTLINKELNGGSFGPAGDPDNSFNGFAQSNELAVVINTPSNGFIQKKFIDAGATGSDNPQWNGSDGTRHVVWDLSKFTSADGKSLQQFITDNNATDARFWMVTQGSDSNGHQGPMRFYFDNFVVTDGTTNTVIGDFDPFNVSRLVAVAHVPDSDAIGFNPEDGLLYHTSGDSSYRNDPADPGYRDNQYMETIDVASGSNAMKAVFNANSPLYGLPGPMPTWTLPQPRRTDEQNTDEFKNARGPGEYDTTRDITWSMADKAFIVSTGSTLYRLAADGSTSTPIGDPGLGAGGTKGITFFNVGGRRVLLVSERDGADLYQVDPATGQQVDLVTVTDANGTPIPGLLSLVESPDGNNLLAIGKDPNDPKNAFVRQLLVIDPVTGSASTIGTFNVQMADLAFVYPVARPAQVSEVYVRGSTWNPAFKAYLAGHNLGDASLGYRVDNTPGNDVAPWTNMDEVVVRYSAPPSGSGVPQAGTVVVHGQRGEYSVTQVTQIDPQTFALKLNRNLGVLANGTDNGDRITLTVPNGGPGSGDSVTHFNVLQGDVNRSGSVLANDYSEVKARFFKNTASPVTGTNDYSPFHDVDGSGSILANDYSAVKARFFDSLPAPAAAASAGSLASITGEVFGTKRLLE